MAAPYNVETYLLDKANIQDTMVRMVSGPLVSFLPFFLRPQASRTKHADPPQMHSFDTKATSTLINSVYTSEVHLDYDPFLGGSPEVVSSEVWAKRLEHIHDPYDSTQHVVQ